MASFRKSIIDHIDASYQIILVPTHEESRALAELVDVAREKNWGFARWDQLSGYGEYAENGDKIMNPTDAITNIPIEKFFPDKNTIVVMNDLHHFYFENPDVRRALRGMSERSKFNNTKWKRPLILLQPTSRIHPDMSAVITTIDFNLPTPEELGAIFDTTLSNIKDEAKRVCSEGLKHSIIQGLRGLTSIEAINCLSLGLIRHRRFVPELVQTVEDTKASMLKRTEILTYVPKNQIAPLAELGGYDDLAAFVAQRALAYSPEAEAAHMDMPKGIVLLGVPGTGKSKAAESIARRLDLPLVIFDFSAVFNSLVGESERRTREVISQVTALGGCVLLIDEADKALGGSNESSGDSGVTRRVFGQILTWLAKKQDRTFVVMTMNRTKGMPPELLRKGRFDDIFYVDVPSSEERRLIFTIHLNKRGVNPESFSDADWKRFLKASDGFVGSEIEESVKSARFAAFQLGKIRRLIDESTRIKNDRAQKARVDELQLEIANYSQALQMAALDLSPENMDHAINGIPSADQLVQAIEEAAITRVTRVDAASIDEIRKFGTERARSVSSARRPVKPEARNRRGVDLSDA